MAAGAQASTLDTARRTLRRAHHRRPPQPERFPRRPVKAYELTVQSAFDRFDSSLATRNGHPISVCTTSDPGDRNALVAARCLPPVTADGMRWARYPPSCPRLPKHPRTRLREDTSLRPLQPTCCQQEPGRTINSRSVGSRFPDRRFRPRPSTRTPVRALGRVRPRWRRLAASGIADSSGDAVWRRGHQLRP
jgi:hypothetical protein